MAKYALKDVSTNFMKTVKANGNKEIRENIFELFRRIILKTPVKTGTAQANWQINISTPGKNVVKYSGNAGAAKTQALNNGLEKLSKVGIGRTIYIFNNLPYIGELEHGSSKIQAPAGMVQVTLNELRTLFK